MSEITFEPINADSEPTETVEEAQSPEPPGSLEKSEALTLWPAPPKPAAAEAPQKRKPGRPKGSANKPKAVTQAPEPHSFWPQDSVVPTRAPRPKPKKVAVAPPQPSDESSSSEEDERILSNLMQDDMETQILQFLTARKAEQANKRHALWTNLASSGLR